MRCIHPLIHSLAAVTLMLTLASCAGSGQPGSPESPGASGAQETPAAHGPRSLFSAACVDLVPLADIQGALNDAVEPNDFAIEPGGSWPLAVVGLRQSGALRCHWSDTVNQQGEFPKALEVTVVPHADDSYATWREEMASWLDDTDFGDESYGECRHPASSSCQYDILVGSSWLRIRLSQIPDPALAPPLVTAITTAVSNATVAEADWAAPESSVRLPASCAELLTVEEVGAAIATEGMVERDAPLLMPFVINVGAEESLNCKWTNSYSSAQAMPISVTVLPGAAWAWEGEWAKERPSRGPVTPQSGLGDAAYAGCTTDESNVCFVDVLADGAWVSVDGNNQAGIDALSALASKALAALGYSG